MMSDTNSEANGSVGRRLRFLGNLGGILFPLGALALLIVPGILFYQIRDWLQSGVWHDITVADGLRWAGISKPHLGYGGFELLTDKFLGFPLWVVLLVAIAGPMIVYAQFSQWLGRKYEADALHARRLH